MKCDSGLKEQLTADLRRQAQWAGIVPYIEQHSDEVRAKQQKSPATYAKHKRWLLNTERLTIAQVLVYRELVGKSAISQGEFVRLLGGNPNRDGLQEIEQREILTLNQYWANQVRNNIRPIMADYFGLIDVTWESADKPGTGEYSIRPGELLLGFFTSTLYCVN